MTRSTTTRIRIASIIAVLCLTTATVLISDRFERLMPTAHAAQSYVWVGGEGSWDNPAKWSPNGVPGPGDTAILDSNSRVYLDSARTVGTFIMSAGELRSYTLTTTDAFTWSGGTLDFGVEVLAPAGSVVTLNGTGQKNIGGFQAGDGFLTINGTGSMSGSGLSIGNSGVLRVNGTLDVADTTINGDSPFRVGAGGTLNKTGTGTTAINTPFENSGTVNVPAGMLALGNGGSNPNASSYAVSAGATLRFAGGQHNFSNTLNVTGGGAVEFSGGSVNVSSFGAFSVSSLAINGGAFAPAANVALPTGAAFTFSSGDLFGNGSLIADGPSTFSGGRIRFSGTLTLGPNGVMTINNASPIVIGEFQQGLGTLNILGSATVTGAGGFNFGANGDGSAINVSGTLTLETDADFNGGSNSFVKVQPGGLLHRTTGGGTTNVTTSFVNNGTVDFDTGTLVLNGGSGNSAASSFVFDPGTSLRFAGGTHNYNSAVGITGGGAVEVSGGLVTINSGASTLNVGNFTISGGIFAPGANITLPPSATFNFTGGDLRTNAAGGALTVNGPGTFSGGKIIGSGILNIGQTGALTINNAAPIQLGAFQAGLGTINVLGSATVTGVGGFSFESNGSFSEINVGGTFDVQSDADFTGNSNHRINVNTGGTFRKSAGATTVLSLPVINAGTLSVQNSTLQLAGTFTHNAGMIALNGGTLALNTTLNLNAGALVGTGIVDGNVVNASTVSPGLAPNTAGQLSVTGGYTQTAAGRLKIEIGGTANNQFDRLLTNTNNATTDFAGTLDLSLINNFHPTASDTFTIAQYFSHQGEFAPVNGLDFGSGGHFTPNYQPNNLVLAAGQLSDVPGCEGPARPWVHLIAPATFRSANNGAFKYKTRVLYGNTGCTETTALVRVVVSNTLPTDLTRLLGLDVSSIVSVPNSIYENGPALINLPDGRRQLAVIVRQPGYNPTATPTPLPTPTPAPSPNAPSVVVSEFRTRGPAGPDDEFIELYNKSDSPVNVGGWKIRSSDNAGNITDNMTINPATMIPAHGHLLIANNAHYTDNTTPDQSYTVGIADNGGIAVTLPDNTIMDQLGLSPGSAFGEGTSLPPLPDDTDDSYERNPGGPAGSADDSGDNSADFHEHPSAPQNQSDLPTPGGGSTGNNLPPGIAGFDVEVSSPPGTGGGGGGGARNNCDVNMPLDADVDDLGAIGPFIGTGCVTIGACGPGSSSARPRGLCAADPNDKVGSGGAGLPQYISGAPLLPYAIFFENKPDATAPAGAVVLTDQLDLTKFDLDTFQLGAVSFSNMSVSPPAFVSEYHTDVDLRPAKNTIVRVDAKLDKQTGLITWRFASLDPATMNPTTDPLAGFLPPNQTAPEGEGSVLFLIRPKAGLASGTELHNSATIVFDQNDPIDTGDWLNTIDNDLPSSQVAALAPTQSTNSFTVNWSGTDAHSGVNNYNVYVSEDGGPYNVWRRNTNATSDTYTGQPGKSYAFYTTARDNTGNVEEKPTDQNGGVIPDATTQVAVPSLQLSAATYSIAENAGHADVSVTRTANTSGALSVTLATADGTATAGTDYTAVNTVVQFADGETNKTIPIPILNDTDEESNETINLSLSNQSAGATLGGQTSAVLTIIDDEAPPALSIGNAFVAEPANGTTNTASFTVKLSRAAAQAVTVNFATADDSAQAGSDYVAATGTLTFQPNGPLTQLVNVTVNGDALAEPNETFFVNLSNAAGASLANAHGTGTITSLATAGQLLISEFRFRGPVFSAAQGIDGFRDEFIELYNNTNSPVTVATNDGSAGWTLAALNSNNDGADVLVTIPNGTVIPARGHFLAVNSDEDSSVPAQQNIVPNGGYSLNSYAVGDAFYVTDVSDNAGVALFSTANAANFTAATRLDAAGFAGPSGATADLFREGAGLSSPGANDGQYAFVRHLETGIPQDTDNNAQDFVFVSTDGGAYGGVLSVLGAPGPENCGCNPQNPFTDGVSPTQRNATIKASLIEPQALSTAAPNRVRDTSAVGANAPLGTLELRRRFKNSTGQPVTRLRFRVVDVTTLNTPNPGGAQADVRWLSSNDTQVTTSLGALTVRGTTIDLPLQPSGGGLNATGTVAVTAIAPGATVDVRFVLGVAAGGRFRFLVNVEALTGAPVPMTGKQGPPRKQLQ